MASARRGIEGEAGQALPARERRVHERVEVALEVDYVADDTFLFAYITDISAMGIFVRTPIPEVPGTRLTLRFTAVSGETLELDGEVKWINPPQPEGAIEPLDGESHQPGMGVQFVDLDDEDRRALLNLVRTFAYLDDPADDEEARRTRC